MSESLPSSRSEVQFNVPVNRLQQPDMPVLTGMADAFQRGALDVQTLFKSASMGSDLKRQKAEDEVRVTKAKSAMELEPTEIKARIAELESKLSDITRKKTAELPDDDLTKQALAFGGPQFLDRVKTYKAKFGVVPSGAGGVGYDFGAVNEQVDQIENANALAASQSGNALDPKDREFYVKQGLVIGNKTPNELQTEYNTKVNATGGLTALQAQDRADLLDRNELFYDDLLDVQELMKQTNLVGPVRGSWLGRGAAWLSAALGDATVKNGQDRIIMMANQKVAEGTQLLKGSLSEKELRFIQATVPDLSKTEAVWNNYITPRLELIKKVNARIRAGMLAPPLEGQDALTPAQREEASFSTPATERAGAAPSAAEVQSLKPSPIQFTPAQRNAAVLVRSAKEFQDLPPGTLATSGDGVFKVR